MHSILYTMFQFYPLSKFHCLSNTNGWRPKSTFFSKLLRFFQKALLLCNNDFSRAKFTYK